MAAQEILKRVGCLCRPPWLGKEILRYKITLEAISFWQNIFISIFKSYEFFKIYERFDKEREKACLQQSLRKEKLRKAGLCFIKPFKMIINLFFISQAHSQGNHCFLISGISKEETGNGK